MVRSRLVSHGLIFLHSSPVDIQLVNFLLVSNIKELTIVKEIKFCDSYHYL